MTANQLVSEPRRRILAEQLEARNALSGDGMP
jgi:hypothetical protein